MSGGPGQCIYMPSSQDSIFDSVARHSPRDATKCIPLAEDKGLLGALATVSSSGCGPVGSGCAAC